ncbi:MFS transporter [Brevibacterium sp.]|uniref:MFS transporter n=1 Tax=Brevibacterium sp. TaxID=1701 RepID=UPI0028120887|nr:MFS transporter [Brevibacterium sp.]
MTDTVARINDLKPSKKVLSRAVLAGSFGNLMEQYDNLIYAYSAVTIGLLFFPGEDPVTQLLSTFAVFAVGFLARPVGTLVFGHFGDKYGRRKAMIFSVILMGLATVGVGILPTFEQVGVIAPVLLVVLRLLQGFAIAGEWTGSTAMLVEFAPKNRRGLFGSFNQVTTAGGFLLASAVVALNSFLFGEEAINEYAWRFPFLLGILTLAVAVLLRLGLEDTPSFKKQQREGTTVQNPLRESLRSQKRAILRGFGFNVGWTVAYFFFLTYIPSYLTNIAGVDPSVARSSNLVALVVMTVAVAVFGALSDKVGRKPLLLTGMGGFILLTWPVLLLFNSGSVAAVYIGQLVVVLVLAVFSGAGPAALAELFPTNVRYSALGIGYNFSVMGFGGTAPFIATAIVGATGAPQTVAILPILAAIVTFLVVARSPESSHLPLR